MEENPSPPITVLPFEWNHWSTLWELRIHQLAEFGIKIPLEEIPDSPQNVGRDDPEWDYDHIAEVYLNGRGGFWFAYWQKEPVGHIAGQDLGGVLELRHMYVREEYRRRGIAACLVQALLDHCKTHKVKAVELWTGCEDIGRKLYEKMGFRVVSWPGREFHDLFDRTNYLPGEDEVRMRIDLV